MNVPGSRLFKPFSLTYVMLAIILPAFLFWGCKPSTTAPKTEASKGGETSQGTPAGPQTGGEDEFIRLSNSARNFYERGEAEKAMGLFEKASVLQPSNLDGLLNLANAALLANKPDQALRHAEQALQLDRNTAAAHYIAGCSLLRLGRFEDAVKALQTCKNFDKTVNEVSFQLGRAHQGFNQHEAAAVQFEEVIRFGPEHPAAHYALSQSLLRLGRQEEAQRALAEHQRLHAGKPAQITDPALFERCKYTQARVPFRQEQPDGKGVTVRFSDATTEFLGAESKVFRGPVAVVDYLQNRNSLFLREGEKGWRLFANSNGTLRAVSTNFPAKVGVNYARTFVADFNNDRADDVLLMGQGGSHMIRITTNGVINDATGFANLRSLSGTNGALVDQLFTGNIGLMTVGYGSENVRFLRNLGSMYFSTNATNIGIPSGISGVRQVVVDDWNGDDLLDLILQRDAEPVLLLSKVSGGQLVSTQSPADWPVAQAVVTGDINNDLRTDLVCATGEQWMVIFNGQTNRLVYGTAPQRCTRLVLVDYDNDGWLDVFGLGERARAWRNRGDAGFVEVTEMIGLSSLGAVEDLKAADFDNDGDLDLVCVRPDGSLAYLRNEGGNANQLLKLRLVGNKSNTSGIGTKVEVFTSGLRLARRVQELPLEIGVGKYTQIDSVNTRWFTMGLNTVDVKVDSKLPLRLDELVIQETSCPYLYAWDGRRFRFVTDILGASPLGLPIMPGRNVEADPDEYVWLGDDRMFQPRDGNYQVSLTEELREVLYLDEAKLVVVDHVPGVVVHPTDKLLPRGPFPEGGLMPLQNRYPLIKASRLDGVDVTEALQATDRNRVSPVHLRELQLRGLAEPHGVLLDFGPLDKSRPLVLAMTGWLKFGGAMANMAAAERPGLPFPFPSLEVETTSGNWVAVEVTVGAPAGKTKTILVDLEGKLPAGARRMRIVTAFEIHWDEIGLWEKAGEGLMSVHRIGADKTDLHWRGFGKIEPLPWDEPQTHQYDDVVSTPPWRITPGGWATRYGAVDELIQDRDNRLVLVNSGDALVISFAAAKLPPVTAGMKRDFFLFTVGWDKDGDYHVTGRDSFEPLPWHGMDYQKYGREERPKLQNDDWIRQYNTRWCGPEVYSRR